MTATIFAVCHFCEKAAAVTEVYNRPMCQSCRDEYAPGARATARPLPRYEAPRLMAYGKIAELAGEGAAS